MAETKVTSTEIELQQAWQTPTLLNSWVNYGSGFNNAQYMKDSLGFVHLRGMVKSGVGVIFTLPAGYRPEGVGYHAGASAASSAGIVAVHTDGTITMDNGNNAYISLDSVIFKAFA